MRAIEAELPAVRATEAEARQALQQARTRFVEASDKSPRGSTFREADRARAEHDAAARALDDLRAEHEALLAMFGDRSGAGRFGGDRDGPRSGDLRGGRGFEHVARELDLATGRTRVDVALGDLLPMAGVKIEPGEGLIAPALNVPAMVPLPANRSFLFTQLATEMVDPGVLALSEFKQKGARTLEKIGEVTPPVLRDPASVEEKAKLALEPEAVTPSLKQLAIVIEDCPQQLIESVPLFTNWLQSEASLQLYSALDTHVLAQIATAPGLGKGKVGADTIAKLRNSVGSMRALGVNPTIAAVNPKDAAELDLTKTEAGGYTFATRDVAGASPIFGLTVVESAGVNRS